MALAKFDVMAYFKEVAEKHPLIKHTDEKPGFFRISGLGGMEEMLNKSTYANQYVLCVEDTDDGRFHMEADYYTDLPQFAIYILKRTPAGNDNERQKSKDDCKKIALEIFARLEHHYRFDLHGLKDFDWDVTRYGVGPIAQNYWGNRYGFSMETPLGMPKYDPAYWGE